MRTPGRLHLAHNFTFVRHDWSADDVRAVVDQFDAVLGDGGWAPGFSTITTTRARPRGSMPAASEPRGPGSPRRCC